MKFVTRILVVTSLFMSTLALAEPLSVEQAYIRATPPNAQNSAAFMVINNNSEKTINLTEVSSDIADRVELHNHIMQDDVMKMRQVEQITIASGEQAILQPGGLHVMFIGLKQPLPEGKTVTITLHFDNDNTIELDLPIKKIKMMKH